MIKMHRHVAGLLLVASSLAGSAVLHAQAVPAPIAKALADPARADQAGDDERRKAAESIAFSGVKPGWTVIDYLPGKGYWTRIFTGVVGPRGHVFALWPAASGERAATTIADLNGRHLANVTAQAAEISVLPQKADLFWTVENYHDFANPGGEAALAKFNKAVFASLKPGGTYIVIDHADAAGKGLADTGTLHRIDPAAVKAGVVAAGFRFVGESKALANPADDHSLKVFDPAIRGHTDQFIYKFVKPAR